MKILGPVLILIALYYAYRLTRLIIKRLVAVKKLRSLGEREHIKVRFFRSTAATLFKTSATPDASAEIGNKIYLIRFYNGRGRRTQAHFANEEYSVVFSILLIKSFFAFSGRHFGISGKSTHAKSTSSFRVKVKIMPKLETPEEYANAENDGKKIIPVLLFNPSPSNVSYVSDEKTSIKLAFTGDEFRGIKIFTGSTLVNYLEREARSLAEDGVTFSERREY